MGPAAQQLNFRQTDAGERACAFTGDTLRIAEASVTHGVALGCRQFLPQQKGRRRDNHRQRKHARSE
jgi:hypothetical protein